MIDNSVATFVQKIANLIERKHSLQIGRCENDLADIQKSEEMKVLLQIDLLEAEKKVNFYKNKSAPVRASKFISEFNKSTSDIEKTEELIKLLENVSLNKDLVNNTVKLQYWLNILKQAQIRISPLDKKSNDSNSNDSVSSNSSLQEKYIKAYDNSVPIVREYLMHRNSIEGNALRDLALRIRQENSIEGNFNIPLNIENQRNCLNTRIGNCNVNDKKTKNENTYSSLFDNLTGAVPLLHLMKQMCNVITAECIDFEMEEYFYSLCGSFIFQKLKMTEIDKSIYDKCVLLSKERVTAFGLHPSLAKYGNELFQKTISYIKSIAVKSSPTAKVITICKAVESLIAEFSDKTGDRLSADDLINPLLYCCVKARVTNFKTQIDFIEKFVKPSILQGNFESYFTALKSVVSNIMDLNVAEFVAKDKSAPQERQIPLVIAPIPEGFPGVESIQNPVAVGGYKAVAIPSLYFNVKSLTHVVAVPTGNDSDVVMMRPVIVTEDPQGERVASILLHPPQINTKIIQTNEGLIAALQQPSNEIINEMAEVSTEDIDTKKYATLMQYIAIDSLPGSLSLEEHVKQARDLYNSNTDDIINEIIAPVAKSLHILGFLDSQSPVINEHFVTALRKYQEFYNKDNEKIERYLTPGLCTRIFNTVKNWKNAFMISYFGLEEDTDWIAGVAILQYVTELPVTGILDQRTVELAREIFTFALTSGEINGEEAVKLNSVL